MIQPIWICWCLVNWIVIIQGNSECGILNKMSDKIVGGRPVNFVKYPWYTGLFQATDLRNIVCGGTLIDSTHVLTAAHCFKPWFEAVKNNKIEFEDIYVAKLGISNVCIPEHNQQTFSTKTVYIHERYALDMPYFDIALIELENNADSMPCCLPKERYESNNRSQEPAVIIGLGKEASDAWKLPCNINEAEVPIQPDKVCKNMLASKGINPSTFQGAFCAGFLEGKVDTCQGDSGGPLHVKESDDIYTVLGITSFGIGCANKDALGVYTDVSHYLNWIHEKMKKSVETNTTESKQHRINPTTSTSIEVNENIDTISTITTTDANNQNKDETPTASTPRVQRRRNRIESALKRLLKRLNSI